MDNVFAIERFCYLGNLKSVYVAKTSKIDCENSEEHYKLVESVKGAEFLNVIRECWKRETLPRKDELWYIFAIYMSSKVNQIDKTLVSKEFASLATEAEDLFMFAHYSKQLREANGKRGFSNSVRRAISQWYEKQDINLFMNFILKNVGMYGFTHRDLISLCHVNVRENGLDTVLDHVFKAKKRKIDESSLSEGMKAFIDIHTCKKSGDNALMKRLIQEKKFEFEYFPSTQKSQVESWKLILPTMTCRQLIENIYFLAERGFFKNEKFKKQYLAALDKNDAIIKENVHPFTLLCLKNRFLKQMRYSEAVKHAFHSAAITNESNENPTKPDEKLIEKISKIFEKSINSYKGPPIRTMVTLNIHLEKFKRQTVISQKQVNCFDAAVTLALSYYKNCEKPSSVYSFSRKLKKLEWKKAWNFIEVCEFCKPFETTEVIQRLILPIEVACSFKTEVFDLFLIIVGSATFGNPNGKPDHVIESLQKYRQTKNPNAKVVILNLRRFRPSMEYSDLKSDGILEICGINENAIKVINAFALGHFN